MTIVNMALSATRGLIATDSLIFSEETALYRADGSPAEETKVIALPLQRMVISGLGSQALRQHLGLNTHLLPDIDAALVEIPPVLRHAWPTHRTHKGPGSRYSDAGGSSAPSSRRRMTSRPRCMTQKARPCGGASIRGSR
jgi:hypothetical protein